MLRKPISSWMTLQKRYIYFPWGHTTEESLRAKQLRKERQILKMAPTAPRKESIPSSSIKDQILLSNKASSHVPVLESSTSLMVTKEEEYLALKRNYLPSRIDDELEVFHDPAKGPFMERTHSQWTRKLWLPPMSFITNYDYYVQEERKSQLTSLIKVQLLDEDRLSALGPDLSAAWFLISRNCKIKFKDNDTWIEVNSQKKINSPLPATYEPGYYLEGIEASRSLLIYEGLQNLRNLQFLKHFDVSYCEMVDEWFIDRIAGEYRDSLEYLDISGCYRLDWNGIEPLARFKKLKVLVLRDLDHIKDLKLLCLLLLELNPDLDIRGVDYIDVELLKASGNEELLDDFDKELLYLQEGLEVKS
ncbi:distal membrane-arm assembly complex protein 2 [Lepeophtheirus salmonis]|uniref:distal membrane-arm assembly complex protein 2 n=1 Tax=Lepeophtheirus salmonis TaxID=72036 RepID=UPI001AE48D60|nr:distal membrane-arm assembly complex protein 2-like [Lepeophtheirus salmonis]